MTECRARCRYALFWLAFKAKWLVCCPYRSNLPCSSTVTRWWLELTGCGFILWVPGVPRVRCGKRIHYSWRFWLEGPCNYPTWRWLHVKGGPP